MKKNLRKKVTAMLIASELLIVSMLIIVLPWKEREPDISTASVEESAEKIGKVTIYQDSVLIYEYQGPLEVNHVDGTHEIEVQTTSCSCFEPNEVTK